MKITDLIQWLRSPSDVLRDRVFHGGVWAFLLNSSNRFSQLIKTVILARLLAPDAFGVVGLGVVLLTALERMTDPGFDKALVQREEDDVDDLLDTAWTVQLLQGGIIAAVLFATAPYAANFFGDPRLKPILQVFALIPVFRGLTNPAVVYFRKDIEMQKQFLYRFSGNLSDVLVAIALALWLQNLWALAIGVVVGDAIQFIFSHILTKKRPGIGFNERHARQLFGFGKWIYVGILTLFIIQSGDDLFVGWLLGSATLGLYRVSFRFGNAPATEISNVILMVMFPAFAKLQNDQDRLQRAFERVLSVVLVTTVPMAVGIILVADAFTLVVLGPQWEPMVPILQIIAVAGMFRALVTLGKGLFRGYGTPKTEFKMNIIRLLVVLGTIWPLSQRYGAVGVAASVTLALAVVLPYWAVKTHLISDVPYRTYVSAIVVPTVGAATMAVPVYVLVGPTWFDLIGAIGIGVLTYGTVLYLSYRSLGRPRFGTWLPSET